MSFYKKLINNFSQTASSDTGTITAQSMQQAFQNGVIGGGHHHRPSATQMFNNLAQEVGATSGSASSSATGITETQLTNYLAQLQSSSASTGTGDSRQTNFIQNLVNNFDQISSDGKTITASDLQSAFQNGIIGPHQSGSAGTGSSNSGEWQDPRTVTPDQLQPPIDISV